MGERWYQAFNLISTYMLNLQSFQIWKTSPSQKNMEDFHIHHVCWFSAIYTMCIIRASPLAPPKGPPNAIWGRRRRKSRHLFIRRTRFKPCPQGGGNAGWARGSPRGTLSAARPMLRRLHSSRLPRPSNGAANGNRFAAAQRAVASEHASAGNECHVARFPPLPVLSPLFSRPVSGYK
jgi:hypothetical protein